MQQFLSFLAVWIIYIPFGIGIVLFQKLDNDSRIVLVAVAAGIIPQMIHFYDPKSAAETVSYNLYTPLEFICYWYLFYPKLIDKKSKFVFQILLAAYIACSILFVVKNSGLSDHFINEWVTVNNLIYLLWLAIYLREELVFGRGEFSVRSPFFWFTIGILAYASCTSVLYALWKPIHENNSILTKVWMIQHILNVVVYLIYTLGFIVSKRDKVSLVIQT